MGLCFRMRISPLTYTPSLVCKIHLLLAGFGGLTNVIGIVQDANLGSNPHGVIIDIKTLASKHQGVLHAAVCKLCKPCTRRVLYTVPQPRRLVVGNHLGKLILALAG
jgi:hypothetical protein